VAPDQSAAEVVRTADKPRETLSQLVARILDQLSLSAWLPAGALTLTTILLIKLGSILRDPDTNPGAIDSIRLALTSLGRISIGGGIIVLVSVVVLTMVTQAFSFEAIRLLEGYWGTKPRLERLADRRSDHYRSVAKSLDDLVKDIKEKAWVDVERGLLQARKEAMKEGKTAEFSEELTHLTEASFKAGDPHRKPTDAEVQKIVGFLDSRAWEGYVEANTLRRLRNAEKQRRDYPSAKSILPTRLGNVLRSYEDATEIELLEPYIEDNFDALPKSLQESHDQRRARLDLYCSMVLVCAVFVALAIAILWGEYPYQVGAVLLGLMAILLNYRAAIASARSYGSILGSIVRRLEDPASSADQAG
jgi:hypothetical protein